METTTIVEKLSHMELRNMKSIMVLHECVRMFMQAITEFMPEGDVSHPSRQMMDHACYMKRVMRVVYESMWIAHGELHRSK